MNKFIIAALPHCHIAALPSVFPGQRPFLNDIDKAGQEKANKQHHRHKTVPAELAEIHCVRVKEDYLHIKQHKQDGYQEILDRHGPARITLLFYTTFKCLEFIRCKTLRTKPVRQQHHSRHKKDCEDQLDTYGEVIIGAVDSFSHGNL